MNAQPSPVRTYALISALLTTAGLTSGCNTRAADKTHAAISHARWGASALAGATRKTAKATADFARRARNEIPRWHEVKSGETLTRIARYYGVPVDKLKLLNPLIDPLKLEIGQKLRLRE
jgi:LysM repeat protein